MTSKFLVRLSEGDRECFLEWWSVIDGPVSPPMSEAQLRQYIADKAGGRGLADLDERIARCRETGTSLPYSTLEEQVASNRAGAEWSILTMEQMLEYFLRRNGQGERPRGEATG